MNPGKYKEIITIQRRISKNENGDAKIMWEDFTTLHAYANGLSGTELYEARKNNQEMSIKFVVRYLKKLDCINPRDYRILWHGQAYKIIPPIDNFQFQNRTLQLTAINYDYVKSS